MKETTPRYVEELLDYFRAENYTIVGAKNVEGYPSPAGLHNDGYGDQQDKQPDVLGFDDVNGRFVIGVVKTRDDDLESSDSLTQYDVFFDHKNTKNGKSSRVCFLLPGDMIPEFTAIITHYIHRDYWENMMIIRSKADSDAP